MFGSIPVHAFRHLNAFGSIPDAFRSILVHAFGSIPVAFRSILVHAFGSIPVPFRRIPDQSPGYYSSLGNQRRTCDHGVMNNRRRARSTRKAEGSGPKNIQAKNPENSEADTVALFITEPPKHRKVPNVGL
ncbi:hypothetical protein CDL15_Pgr022324 [Punica granatum]|uniref:Uncharacterized protein n=1 Tax=Punica granatum TaxID=22663 RepID=A0A218VSA7_PUNGR|nr:hypothetical protein CDL15_Pgr022324 [Punica granatum]